MLILPISKWFSENKNLIFVAQVRKELISRKKYQKTSKFDKEIRSDDIFVDF